MAQDTAALEELLPAAAVAQAVEALAARLAPHVDDETVAVCLLTGGLWFAADLTRALARRGRHLLFDALWLASYGDARASGGEVAVRAGLQRPVAGRRVLLIDDVLESGRTLAAARRVVLQAGARSVASAVFAIKPWQGVREEADHAAWRAPARFLAGYGMDGAGRYRGLGGVVALDGRSPDKAKPPADAGG